MAKSAKKRVENQPISISSIYETIKERNFLQELWWDLISDIKEKPTYKRIKAMVDSVINDTVRNFDTDPIDSAERLRRRTALTEISIMTYTVDTVISEVLYKRLQNEFRSMISNIVEEVQKEKRVKENSGLFKPNSMFENIERIFSEGAQKDHGRNMKDSKVQQPNTKYNHMLNLHKGDQPSTKSNYKTSPQSFGIKTDANNVESPRKRGRPRKIRLLETEDEVVNKTPSPKKRGRPSLNSDVKKKKQVLSPTVPNQNRQKNKTLKSVKIERNAEVKEESDAESALSFSMESVSSVHTSELSSFEDDISICSGDEGNGRGKRKVPLKIANDMFLHGKLNQIYQIGKKGEQIKNSTKASVDTSANSMNSVSRKILPRRIRKPNSKYNSETMYCQVKDYSTPQTDSPLGSPEDEVANIISTQPNRSPATKRKSVSDDEEEDLPDLRSIIKDMNSNGSPKKNDVSLKRSFAPFCSTPEKSSNKRYDALDLLKPRHMGSTYGSRGGTAFTVYST